jgi:hypothetical protein
MKRSFGIPLALFGLLLALAMVCVTSAQGPKPEAPAADPNATQPATTAPDVSSPAPRGGSTPSPRDASNANPFGPQDPLTGPFGPSLPQSSADLAVPTNFRPGRSRPPVAASTPARAMPLVVGRYQAVSHNGKLIVLDTATGECFSHNGSGWGSVVPPIDANSIPAPAESTGPGAPPDAPPQDTPRAFR